MNAKRLCGDRRPGFAAALALCLTLLLAACAGPKAPALVLAAPDLPPRVMLADVPFFPQATSNDCGPAALAMMLAWSGIETDPDRVAPMVYTPGREGTLQHDIVAASRREGRLAVPVTTLEALTVELAAGNPVLVLQNLAFSWWPQWHYAVVVGYERASGDLLLHSGEQAALRTPLAAFLRTWSASGRWGLAVTPPGRLPASGDEQAMLRAANGLEQAGRPDAAAIAYHVALGRWPKSLGALMGWGNAHFVAGEVDDAAKAFRAAVILHPEAAEAWNNLAYSLAGLGRIEEAMESAEKAVALGGPHQATAEETLAEIRAMDG